VIKVEPKGGEHLRRRGVVGGASLPFAMLNANKKSVSLDLKNPQGRDLLIEMVRRADVLVENFAPGTLEGWGLGYDALAAINPGLVLCSITGYGRDGPDAGRPGYDFAVQARAGWMSITGEAEGAPMKVGVALVDVLTGQNAAVAILAALRERDRSGLGQRVEVALFDSALAGLVNVAQAALVTGAAPRRWGNAHATIVPYQTFDAADRPFALAVGNDGQWRRLCGVLGADDLARDPRFATNPGRVESREVLVPLLADRLRARPAAEWLRECEAAGVPCSPVQSVGEALADPVLTARGGPWPMEGGTYGRVATVPSPLRLARTPATAFRPAPALGEHTAEVEQDGWLPRTGG